MTPVYTTKSASIIWQKQNELPYHSVSLQSMTCSFNISVKSSLWILNTFNDFLSDFNLHHIKNNNKPIMQSEVNYQLYLLDMWSHLCASISTVCGPFFCKWNMENGCNSTILLSLVCGTFTLKLKAEILINEYYPNSNENTTNQMQPLNMTKTEYKTFSDAQMFKRVSTKRQDISQLPNVWSIDVQNEKRNVWKLILHR